MIPILKIQLPFEDPILIFTLIVIIILLTPILFRKLNIPGIVGLILAGAILGPHGFNVLLRDASILLFGTVGLLYIMFLSGLEMNLEEFRKKIHRSVTFGLLTFIIPQGLGMLVALYFLDFSLEASILLASMFASHTLLAYPIVSKLGLTRTEAATVTFGGTLITNILALLVLSVIVAMAGGELNRQFWVLLGLYSVIFGVIIFAGIPLVGSWFFKNFEGEGVSHYLFVLAVVFGSSFLAGVFRLEPIIGAFVAGLALNRLIPKASPLMNRIEFVGNTLFIPFFLIGTGMIVDAGILVRDPYAVMVAAAMIITATSAKWLAAFLTQKTFRYSVDERNVIFGLSNAQAASTLAAVVIGYNIGLFNESVLNGTILMILFTCLISSFVTDRAGRKMAVSEKFREHGLSDSHERILVPIANPSTIDKLMDLAFFIRHPRSVEPVYPLTVVIEKGNHEVLTSRLLESKKMLEAAIDHGSSADNPVQLISKVDVNVASGIVRACKELIITDIVIGWNGRLGAREKIFGSILDIVVQKMPVNTLVYKPLAPLNTIRRVYLVVPKNAEYEKGFEKWVTKVLNISNQTKSSIWFYGLRSTMTAIEWSLDGLQVKKNIRFNEFEKWDQFTDLANAIRPNDLLIVVSGRQGSISYTKHHDYIPRLLSKYFYAHSFIIIFPEISVSEHEVDSNLQLEIPAYPAFASKSRLLKKPGSEIPKTETDAG
jgi:Kef-type K+ transport system membrane component KefB/nucleotide-binding universal stress UspA family protein